MTTKNLLVKSISDVLQKKVEENEFLTPFNVECVYLSDIEAIFISAYQNDNYAEVACADFDDAYAEGKSVEWIADAIIYNLIDKIKLTGYELQQNTTECANKGFSRVLAKLYSYFTKN